MSDKPAPPATDARASHLPTLREDFLRALLRLLQTARIHQDNNKLLTEAVEDFLRAIHGFGAHEDTLTLQLAAGRLFLQAEKVPYLNRTAMVTNQLRELMEKLNLPGLRFSTHRQAITPQSAIRFVRILGAAAAAPDASLADLLTEEFSWVEIITASDLRIDEEQERRERGLRTYSQALASLKEVTRKLTDRKVVGVRKAVRIAQKMADLILEAEPVLLGMSTIRDYDDYTHTHSVNVAILSMCLGARIGLSPAAMEKLGICALFHDLGKVEIPVEILNKEGRLSDKEFEEIQKHSLNSVRQIIKLQTAGDLKSKILLPPFEHHLKYDLSGYPRKSWSKPISLFGRIVAIADVFDAITSPRKYRHTALSPDRAIHLMLKGAGSDYDPILLKVFIAMLGPYPLGTLLELKNGQLGLVMGPAGKKKLERLRPRVVILEPLADGGYQRGKIIDLAERRPDTGDYCHEIHQSHNSAVCGVQPAAYII